MTLSRHTILLASAILLQGWAPAVVAAPKPISSPVLRVSSFTFHPEEGVIVLPIQGPQPDWKVFLEPRGRVAYMEVPLPPTSATFLSRTQSVNPSSGLVARVLVANNRPGVVRIAVRGRAPIRFHPEVVSLGGDRSLLKIHVLPYQQKAPAAPARPPHWEQPVAPAPRPERPVTPPPASPVPIAPPPPPAPPSASPVPPAAEEIRLPLPEPSPEPVRPVVVPTPEPEGPEPLSRVDVGRTTVDFSEDYAWGGSKQVKVSGLMAWHGTWSQRWSEQWGTRLQVMKWEPYTILDLDLQGSTHVRTETAARLTADWHAQPLGVPLSVGAGGWVRAARVENTFEPLAPLYLFSKQQLYMGPVFDARTTVPIWGPLRAVLGVELKPAVLPIFDADVDSAGLLLGAGAEGGLELAWRMAALRATYRMETLRAPDFASFAQDHAGVNVGLAVRY